MAENYKAQPLTVIRELLEARGPEVLADAKARLSPTEREVFEKSLPIAWIDVGLAAEVFVKLCPLIYPRSPDPVHEFGRVLAADNVKGVYRVLLKVISIETLIKQAARLWGTYHREGRAAVEDVADNRGCFVVRDYPRYPAGMRRNTSGYLTGLVEMTGKRSVRVREDGDAGRWQWFITWS